MSEESYTGPTPEELELQEQEERYALYMKNHPDVVIPPENLRESGPEVAQLEEMLVAFESTYSLEELHAITDLTAEEAPKHPIRAPAKEALGHIVAKLHTIKHETNVSLQKYEELRARYRQLNYAVGLINKDGKVDHDR